MTGTGNGNDDQGPPEGGAPEKPSWKRSGSSPWSGSGEVAGASGSEASEAAAPVEDPEPDPWRESVPASEGDADFEKTMAEPDRTMMEAIPSQDTALPPAASVDPAEMTMMEAGPGGETAPAPPSIPGVEITSVLGRGGQAIVYLGRQTYIDRKVAIKVVESGSSDSFVRRFRREAKILAGMTHPHIVGCHNAGMTPRGDCFLVMEFIDGPNLAEWIEDQGRMEIAGALHLTREVAQALRHAHELSVIHRDVKPQNVLLQPSSSAPSSFPFKVKLADLGLARSVGDAGEGTQVTIQGAVMGTPATMAPEQFDDPDNVDFRADIYGLGCVLYHALSGEPAYNATSLIQLIKLKAERHRPDIRKKRSDVPSSVVALVRAMLAPDRDKRPQSYDALIASIEAAESSLGAKAASTRPAWLPKAAVAGAVVVAGALFLFSGGDDGEADPEPIETTPAVGSATPRDGSEADPGESETVAVTPPVVAPTPELPALTLSADPRRPEAGERVELRASFAGDLEGLGFDEDAIDYHWSHPRGHDLRLDATGPEVSFTAPAGLLDSTLSFRVVATTSLRGEERESSIEWDLPIEPADLGTPLASGASLPLIDPSAMEDPDAWTPGTNEWTTERTGWGARLTDTTAYINGFSSKTRPASTLRRPLPAGDWRLDVEISFGSAVTQESSAVLRLAESGRIAFRVLSIGQREYTFLAEHAAHPDADPQPWFERTLDTMADIDGYDDPGVPRAFLTLVYEDGQLEAELFADPERTDSLIRRSLDLVNRGLYFAPTDLELLVDAGAAQFRGHLTGL